MSYLPVDKEIHGFFIFGGCEMNLRMNENVMVRITEVTFYPIKPTDKGLIGFCSCLFDGKLSLNSIAIYTQSNGNIRLVFPQTSLANGKVVNVFYPIDSTTYEAIKYAIAMKIEKVTQEVIGGILDADGKT